MAEERLTPTLPEYDNPPVSEVALSVLFSPLEKFRSPHLGLYWAEINKEYPTTESQMPIPPQIERFGEELWSNHPKFRVEIAGPWETGRTWFIGEPPTRVLQIQNNRFTFNWRKVKGDETYPRYAKEISPRFRREWDRFRQFVDRHEVGPVEVLQCELEYLNDLPKGEAWNTFSDLKRIFTFWSDNRTEKFLPSLETAGLSGSFLMANQQGRLHIMIQHLKRSTDGKEVIQFRLIARGKPSSGRNDDIFEWMDRARIWIVNGFTDLTCSEMQTNLWRRTR
jgi:uncharacterized protein (TIGR04255 family)